MKIAVIGTGGVGGYFGGKLAKAGHDVTFLARGQHLQAMQANGLQVKSIKGDFKVDNVKATDKIDAIGPVDLILVCVKAWQIKELAHELASIITPETIVLPLQNGVLASEELASVLPIQNILGGLCRIISKVEAPGIINHLSVEPSIIFGELDNIETERIRQVKQVFEQADIQAKATTQIQVELWKKFITICVSGLLAVTRATYGQLLEIPETKKLMQELIREVYTLAQCMGIAIEEEYLQKTMKSFASLPYDATASLTRDIWEGKPSEIEYQNGTVVRLGEKHNVPTPINRFVYTCLLPQEKIARQNS